MLEDFPDKIHSKLKSRARKGIPDSFRGIAWKTLANIDKTQEENSSIKYLDLIQQESQKKGKLFEEKILF